MTTATRCGNCAAPIYRLPTPDGGLVILDTTPTPLGIWAITGHQARKLTNIDVLIAGTDHAGLRRHECSPAVQPPLFDAGGAL
jgi:hypothetical protein